MFPWIATGFGGGFIVGKLWYAIGYIRQGPRGRSRGFILSQLCGSVLMALSLASAITMGVQWNH